LWNQLLFTFSGNVYTSRVIDMNQKETIMSFREVMRIPGIRRMWTGQLVSITGDFLAIFAVLSITSFRMHATPAQLTGITISYMLPLAVFGPAAGVFVDRWDPKRTMIASDGVRAVLAALLLSAHTIGEIYVILFSIGTVSTFFIPAQTVVVRRLVPRDGLLAANALMQQAVLVIRMASPAVAGALVSRLGPGSCFGLDTFSFLFSAWMLSGIAAPRLVLVRGASEARTVGTVLRDLFAGIRFILSHRDISFVMTAMGAATFAISCFSPLLAAFVRDILRADVRVFGVISAAIGLGMIAGTQAVRRMGDSLPPRQIVLSSLSVITVGIACIGIATSPAVTAAGAFVIGAGVGLLTVPAQTLIQKETPMKMVGRVSSGVMSLISLAQILGLALSGVTAAAIGLRPLFLTSAGILGCLAVLGRRGMRRSAETAVVDQGSKAA
jgi:MFS family permease